MKMTKWYNKFFRYIIVLVIFSFVSCEGLDLLLTIEEESFDFYGKYKDNITLWLDASKAETLYAVSDIGDPIPLADGERIAEWDDNGLNANDLIKYNVDSGYPTYDMDAFPGNKPGIIFANAFMEARTVDIQPATLPEITSIVVFSYQSENDTFWVGCRNDVSYFGRRNHRIVGQSVDTPQISTMILDQTMPLRNQWIDGTHNVIDEPDLFEAGTNIGIGVGQFLYSWHDYKGAYAVNVTIAELIILNRAISEAERIELETYLGQKWSL